mmetsp:Transcript_172026/g.551412  ORF Transcript_172026/g.551412 Transcript_172026/m.551412 type:complete len:407 (+) Transcript_172026:15-1235(+)
MAQNGSFKRLPSGGPDMDQSSDKLMMRSEAIACHPMNVLLIFLPLGSAAYFLKWDDVYVFWFNFFAMIPLAKILGDATEELAASLKNDMVAGLLNATFGNAVEMVITVKTLRAGLYDVVKSTLLGSVLSNTLLVLGMSFLCGGLVTLPERRQGPRPEEQPPPTGEYKGLLADQSDGDTASRGDSRQTNQGTADSLLAVTGEGKKDVPEANEDIRDVVAEKNYYDQFDGAEKIQSFSVLGAVVNTSMLLISCMSFSLITVFRQVSHVEGDAYMEEVLLPVSRIASMIIILAYVAYTVFQLVTHKDAMAADQACMLLFGTTVIVSCCTEMLVTAIGGVTEHVSHQQALHRHHLAAHRRQCLRTCSRGALRHAGQAGVVREHCSVCPTFPCTRDGREPSYLSKVGARRT